VFTGNAPPLQAEATYSKFAAYATLNYGGDFAAAASELSRRGFGSPPAVVVEEPVIELGPADPGPFPEELLEVPGFIGEVMAYNLAGAFRPQPVLALAGALTLMAVLTGRKITDDAKTRTNLYCMGVVETSGGKERAREVNKDILMLSGLDRMLGPESIGSSSGLVNVVDEQPEILLQLDEIGRYLRSMNDAKQSFLFNIITVLMRMFTNSGAIYIGDALADTKKVKKIYQPHVCVYGTTVPQAFYEALTVESLTDGFLGRTLIFEGTADVSKTRPCIDPPPQAILDRAREWGDLKAVGNLTGSFPRPFIIPTASEAIELFDALDVFADSERRRLGEPLGPLWPRSVEKARKAALLWACSDAEGLPKEISVDAALWAIKLVDYLTRRTIHVASRWVSGSAYDAKLKRIMRIVENGGPSGVTRTDIARRSQMPSRERTEIVQDLLTQGLIVEREVVTDRRGPPATRYIAGRFLR
jgi:hypothetical protein